jgi:predicted alpha/beta-fold hydrolase
MAMDPVRLVWTVRSSHDSKAEAKEHAEALQHRNPKLRVRIKPAMEPVLSIKPAVNNQTRTFREQVTAKMSDLADAKKYYKSPG